MWGAFQLLERVSESEVTETFRAQTAEGQPVWLKRARAEALKDEGLGAVLLADLKAAAQLTHPSALPLLAYGEVGGVPYLVQPVLPGWNLGELIHQARGSAQWPPPAEVAAALVKPVLDALAAAHAFSPPVLHRDLAPENVMVAQDGRVLLANFGLARARQRAGAAKGLSRAYVSPEQARGLPVDARSEVFAAGLLLYELACGRLPASGSAGEVISQIASGELDAPLSARPELDPRLAEVLKRALALAPAERFESARAFAEALAPLCPARPERAVGAWADAIDEDAPTQKKEARPASTSVVPAFKPAPPPAPLPPAPAVTERAPVREEPALRAAAPLATTQKAAPPPRSKRFLGPALGLLVLAGLYLALTEVPARFAAQKRITLTTEVVSVPNGAEVFLDGTKQPGLTPTSVELEPNTVHELAVRLATIHSAAVKVQSTKRIEFNLNTGEVNEERYGAGPPKPIPPPKPAPPPEPPAPVAVKASDPEPLHVAINYPAEVRLDHHFQLPLDNSASRALKKGDRLEQESPSRLSFTQGPHLLANPQLQTFALWRDGEALKMQSLDAPLVSDADRSYYFSTFSYRGGWSLPAELKHNEMRVQISALHVPEVKNFFELRMLGANNTYCLTVSTEKAGAPFPPLVLGLERYTPGDVKPELDGEELEGAVQLKAGTHRVTNTESAWLTFPTLEGAAEVPVKLHVDECSENPKKKQRPRPPGRHLDWGTPNVPPDVPPIPD